MIQSARALADLQRRLVQERARCIAEGLDLRRLGFDEVRGHQYRALGVRIACLDWTLDQLDAADRADAVRVIE